MDEPNRKRTDPAYDRDRLKQLNRAFNQTEMARRDAIADLRIANETIEQLRAELAEKMEKARAILSERDSLADQLESERAENNSMKVGYADLEKENKHLKGQIGIQNSRDARRAEKAEAQLERVRETLDVVSSAFCNKPMSLGSISSCATAKKPQCHICEKLAALQSPTGRRSKGHEASARRICPEPSGGKEPFNYRDHIYGRGEPSEGEHCHAGRDGDCEWSGCPQLRDGEPKATGRHCPLDRTSEGE